MTRWDHAVVTFFTQGLQHESWLQATTECTQPGGHTPCVTRPSHVTRHVNDRTRLLCLVFFPPRVRTRTETPGDSTVRASSTSPHRLLENTSARRAPLHATGTTVVRLRLRRRLRDHITTRCMSKLARLRYHRRPFVILARHRNPCTDEGGQRWHACVTGVDCFLFVVRKEGRAVAIHSPVLALARAWRLFPLVKSSAALDRCQWRRSGASGVTLPERQVPCLRSCAHGGLFRAGGVRRGITPMPVATLGGQWRHIARASSWWFLASEQLMIQWRLHSGTQTYGVPVLGFRDTPSPLRKHGSANFSLVEHVVDWSFGLDNIYMNRDTST